MRLTVTGLLVAFSLAIGTALGGSAPVGAQMCERVIEYPGTIEYHRSSSVTGTVPTQTTEQIIEREEEHWSVPSTQTVRVKSTSMARKSSVRRVARFRPSTRRKFVAMQPKVIHKVVSKPVYIHKVVSKPVYIQKIVEKPVFIEKTIERPMIVERPVIVERQVSRVVEKPVYIDRVVEKPVFIDRVVEQPVCIERVIEKPVVIERPMVQERIIERPVIQEKIIQQPVIIKEKSRRHLLNLKVF